MQDTDLIKRQFSLEAIRDDFPILRTSFKDKPLAYLDNAATTQKPQSVIDATQRYYSCQNANVHRGVHHLAELATNVYENARKKVAKFLNAGSEKEIIFTRQATEAINLVAQTWSKTHLKSGDEIIISVMEHHANIVPWQLLAKERGFSIKVIPMTDEGELILESYEALLNHKTQLVSVTHASNALGTVNPVETIIKKAHEKGIPVLLDGAQALPHMPVDIQELDCDFYVFSGHKVFGPTGMGALYAKFDILKDLPPYQGGGDMIERVSFEETTFKAPPTRFEAGTPNIAGAAGLTAAFEYLEQWNAQDLVNHEMKLLEYAQETFKAIKAVQLIGTAKNKVAVMSFAIDGIHPHDIGSFLNEDNIAIRVGHHCTQPLMQRLGVPSTARASFAFYNTFAEVDRLAAGVQKIIKLFK